MPIEAFCSDRYHITVHCQVPWSFFISPAEFAECIVFDPKFRRYPLGIQCPVRNVVCNLRHLQRLLQTLDLLRSKSLSSSFVYLILPFSYRVIISPLYSPALSFPSKPTWPCTHKRVTFFLLLQSYKLFRHSQIILKLINGDLSALMAACYLSCDSCPDFF